MGKRNNYDKITALLEAMDLTDRIVDGTAWTVVPETIGNWDVVRSRLAKRRLESEYFIMNALTVAGQQPHPVKDYLPQKMKQSYKMFYNIGRKHKSVQDNILPAYQGKKDSIFVRKNSVEYLQGKVTNDGSSTLHENVFRIPNLVFQGWRIRVHLDYHKFYLLEDGTFQEITEHKEQPRAKCMVLQAGEPIPVIPLNRIQLCVAEAVWA